MARIRTDINRNPRQEEYLRNLDRRVIQAVKRSANLVRNEAVQGINRQTSSGSVYEKYNPRRTHTASLEGDYPNTDTGNLVRNIAPEFEDGGRIGFVVSKALYSRFLEFGTRHMAERPFLQPSLEKAKGKIRSIFRKLVRGA
tara:strand:- start:9796 stop:10221 length:426 start_codon:yes stop_codon:yes gene_type:complete